MVILIVNLYNLSETVECRCHDFSKKVFNDRTVIVCDQCEKEYHIGCLRENNMADLKVHIYIYNMMGYLSKRINQFIFLRHTFDIVLLLKFYRHCQKGSGSAAQIVREFVPIWQTF